MTILGKRAFGGLAAPGLGQRRTPAVANPITGTGPVLAALTDGDTLSGAVTWGTYEPEGATADQQMRVDGGAWGEYDGDTEVAEGEVWQLREVVTFEDFTRTFTSGTQEALPIPLFPPINILAPSISGTLQVGETISIDPGTWDPTATSYNYRATRNGDPIGGATASTYDLVEDDEGATIGAEVQGVNDDGQSGWVEATGGGTVLPAPGPEPEYERTAFSSTTRSMHSGHSLTDAYYGSPQGNNDGYLTELRDSLFSPATGSSGTYMFKNSFGGSSMEDRWDGNSLARTDIGDYDALMITEAGPPPHLGMTVARTFSDINTRWDRWLKFAANTVENGSAPEVILWSIWPYTDIENGDTWGAEDWKGITFSDALTEYGQIYETMAAYASAKMRALYPSLPGDWRVWVVPGHRFWRRIVADLANNDVPTITTLSELFGDNIHPTNEAQYGLACLAFTCLYQLDLREQTGVYIPDGFNADLREYFWRIAWEIATAYEPIGMGGEESEGSLWTEGVDVDFMPEWTLAAADLTPGWAEIVPSGLNVDTNAAITGTLVEGNLQTMSAPTWEDADGAPVVPAEVEYVWRYDWSEIASEVNTCTPEYDTAGQELAGWFRARLPGGPWTSWLDPSGGGTIGRARWCKLTAGTRNLGGANQVNGYSSGTGVAAFGSIDRQPIAGETLMATWRNAGDSQFVCGFAGDKTALLAGQSVYYDNREFKGTWTYYSNGAGIFGVPVTLMLLAGQADLNQPQVYDFRIAPASP